VLIFTGALAASMVSRVTLFTVWDATRLAAFTPGLTPGVLSRFSERSPMEKTRLTIPFA
jgi:hypothetical protein